MEYLTKEIKKIISSHAKEESPNECCGIIVELNKLYKLIKCENVARNKKNDFKIKAEDYLTATRLGDIIAYYHSHVEDEVGRFSLADAKISRAHEIPLVMYSMRNDNFLIFKN